MEGKITLQGHDFFPVEEGIYETKDDFELDQQNWVWGDFPDMCMGFKWVGEEMHPWILTNDIKYYGRVIDMAYDKKGDNYDSTIHTDTNV